MAQFQELARVLLSAGGAVDPEEKGTYFLYTDNGILTSKFLVGDRWGDQELLAKGVRKSSPATFLLSSRTSLVTYITSSSFISALRYDQEDEEWFEEDDVPTQQVHVDGKVAACFLPGSEEKFYVFLQDPSRRLVCFDSEWTSFVLPADPLAGTPLCATIIDDRIHVFYVSDKDHCLHYLLEEADGIWDDNVMARCVLDDKLTRITVAKNGDGVLEAYILTVGNVVLQVVGAGKSETRELGTVDKGGKFVAGTDAECCPFIWVPIVCWFKVKFTRRKHRHLCW